MLTHHQVVLKSANKGDSNLAREIHHHRQFVHPHIARLYEVIVTENMVWMVLEYCAGTDHATIFVPFHSANMLQAMNYTTTSSNTARYPLPRFRRSLLSLSVLSLTSTTTLAFIVT